MSRYFIDWQVFLFSVFEGFSAFKVYTYVNIYYVSFILPLSEFMEENPANFNVYSSK